MAIKKNNPKTDPADLKARVWVIERRDKGSDKWIIHVIYHEEIPIPEYDVAYRCAHLAELLTDREFRYRAATLTFDDDGRKCTIY